MKGLNMLHISNEEYRKMDGVSSSVLKKLLVSEAHLDYVLKHGWPKTDATILGDAIHEIMDKDKFDVQKASDKFIDESAKFVDVTLYENTLE